MNLNITMIKPIIITLVLVSLGMCRILQVGPGKTYSVPSAAAAVAVNGDTIEIDAGEYAGDVTAWYPNNLTIKGVSGRAHMRAAGANAQGKGTWVIKGNNTVVENIEFSEASVPDENGAGIRQDGGSLTVRNCYFHDNENGILGGDGGGKMLIEYCEFNHNGFGDGYTHNMYISGPDTFILRYSYSHRARIGHNVKTRSKVNFIEYNRIMDEDDGTSSYAIDVPNGGSTYIIGNLIQQGPQTDNSTIVSYGAEGLSNPNSELFFINNTVVNDRGSGTFIYVSSGASALIQNNIFAKNGGVLSGPGNLVTNLVSNNPGLVDMANFDYHLGTNSPAIDAGSDPGSANGYNLSPQFEYQHPSQRKIRNQSGTIDIGAYEYENLTGLFDNHQTADQFFMSQNYPNPFNPTTTIYYQVPASARVQIKVYDVSGKEITNLVDNQISAGSHEVSWNAVDFPTGIYYYQIQAGEFQAVKKMVLIK